MIPERGVKEWARDRLNRLSSTTRWGWGEFISISRAPGTLFVRTYPINSAGARRAVLAWRPDNPLLPAAVVRFDRFVLALRPGDPDRIDIVGYRGSTRMAVSIPTIRVGEVGRFTVTDPGAPRVTIAP